MIRLVLGHPDALFRSAFAVAALQGGVLTVGHAEDAKSTLELGRTERPDVVLADASMITPPLYPPLARLAAAGPRVLILAQAPSGPEAVELVGLGCCGYVSHDLAAADLVSAVRHAAAGRSPLDSVAAAAIVHQWRAATAVAHAELQLSHRELSRRETEILDGMAQGLSVPALAHSFGLSRKTVESHKSRIFSKLGARTQAQAIKIAVADGLVLRSAAPP